MLRRREPRNQEQRAAQADKMEVRDQRPHLLHDAPNRRRCVGQPASKGNHAPLDAVSLERIRDVSRRHVAERRHTPPASLTQSPPQRTEVLLN